MLDDMSGIAVNQGALYGSSENTVKLGGNRKCGDLNFDHAECDALG